MKYLLSICVTLSLVGCVSKRNLKHSEEEYFVDAYKKSVLFGCLNETTQDGLKNLLFQSNDLGLYSEVAVLYHSTYEEAKSLGEDYAKQITPVSYPDSEGKKPGYSNCVSYAFSREIDSTARQQYRQSIKN